MTLSCITAKLIFGITCSLKVSMLEPLPQQIVVETIKPTVINGLYYRSLSTLKGARLPVISKVDESEVVATLEERMGAYRVSIEPLISSWIEQDPLFELASIPLPELRPHRAMPKYSEVEKEIKRDKPPRKSKLRAKVEEVAFAPSIVDKDLSPFEQLFKSKKKEKAAPNSKGLYTLADGNEDMSCLKGNGYMMGVLRDAKRKFGATPVVDSGYRSPAHNKRVSGAKASLHMRCLAMDIKVPGVVKDKLASWLRSYPGMGGVGIYQSGYVHFDKGRRRDWDWRRSRKKR